MKHAVRWMNDDRNVALDQFKHYGWPLASEYEWMAAVDARQLHQKEKKNAKYLFYNQIVIAFHIKYNITLFEESTEGAQSIRRMSCALRKNGVCVVLAGNRLFETAISSVCATGQSTDRPIDGRHVWNALLKDH